MINNLVGMIFEGTGKEFNTYSREENSKEHLQ